MPTKTYDQEFFLASERQSFTSGKRPFSKLPILHKDGSLYYGEWRYVVEDLTLTLVPEDYEINLDTCVTTGQILDWIAQVQLKIWGSPAVVGWLVIALDDILKLQKNYCSFGKSGANDPRRIILHGE